jgi:hypothetical protein
VRSNDLSSDPVARIALVADGALCWPPDDRLKDWDRVINRGHWKEAAEMLEFNERMCTVIWDRSWRCNMIIDVITYLGPDQWAAALADRIGAEELPVHKVWATTPTLLGRKLAFMYDLVRVYDPYPEHQLMFGQKGRLITNVNQLGY